MERSAKIFYGVRADPPTKFLAEAFGAKGAPIPLEGGQNTSYVAGSIVLKPADDMESAQWMAEVFESLPNSPLTRFPRPVKSIHGTWVCEGYVAWSFLTGTHVSGNYKEKLKSSLVFHTLLKDIAKPPFVGIARSSWSAADLVAWQRREFHYAQGFMDLYAQIAPHLRPLDRPCQLIHSDLSGNSSAILPCLRQSSIFPPCGRQTDSRKA